MMGKKNQLLKGVDRHTIICTECTCPASIAVGVVMAVRPASLQQHTQSAMLPSRSTCEYPQGSFSTWLPSHPSWLKCCKVGTSDQVVKSSEGFCFLIGI